MRPRVRAAALVALVAVLASSPAAWSASPAITRQALAANAAFLAYAPVPAGGARALCLVDSGVNTNPDTAPGLVSATALDGGSGRDADPLGHGTIDAAVAGGAGHGVLGAWPQLKIVSVRATDSPSPGQLPTYQFDDYILGIQQCSRPTDGTQVAAIDIPLSSTIPPTPDQVDAFTAAVSLAHAKGISILAAAGNAPGAVQLPGSQPGILPVGAGDTVSGGICPFSASTGLTFYSPGCTIDQIDGADEATCCGNGTSQASAFAAAVLVALRSYAPSLSDAAATQLLVSTAHNGHLDVTAAFRAAGLGAIVDAGRAAIPQAPAPLPLPAVTGSAAGAGGTGGGGAAPGVPPAPPSAPVLALARPRLSGATWRHGVLVITLTTLPRGARLHAKLTFSHRPAMFLSTTQRRLQAHTPFPRRAQLRLTIAQASSATVATKVTRLRGR